MTEPIERELLVRAQRALRDMAKAMIAVSPHLKKPFADAPDRTPWDLIHHRMSVGYDLGHEINRYLSQNDDRLAPELNSRLIDTPGMRDLLSRVARGEVDPGVAVSRMRAVVDAPGVLAVAAQGLPDLATEEET